MISVVHATDHDDRPRVGIVLDSSATFKTVDGEHVAGAALTPSQTRELAYRLLMFAEQIERLTAEVSIDEVVKRIR
jgi:hypothetical protein